MIALKTRRRDAATFKETSEGLNFMEVPGKIRGREKQDPSDSKQANVLEAITGGRPAWKRQTSLRGDRRKRTKRKRQSKKESEKKKTTLREQNLAPRPQGSGSASTKYSSEQREAVPRKVPGGLGERAHKPGGKSFLVRGQGVWYLEARGDLKFREVQSCLLGAQGISGEKKQYTLSLKKG